MRGIDFTLTPEETLIRDTTARLFPMPESRSWTISDSDFDAAGTWQSLVDAGFTGIATDQAFGGAGMTLIEALFAAEEGGRNLAPGLLAFGAIVGPLVVSMCNGPENLIKEVASGSRRLTVAPEGALDLYEDQTGNIKADGTLTFVPDLRGADLLLARGSGPEGPGLVCLDIDALQAQTNTVHTFDPTRRFDELTVRQGNGSGIALIAEGEQAVAVFDQIGNAVMTADLLGGADRCLEMSIAYANQREQFGKKIGSFQAVKHLLVDCHISLELARSACLWATSNIVDRTSEALLATATAKALASEAAKKIAETAIQVHGGIGFTQELPLHLYLKRSHVSASLFGGSGHHYGVIRNSLADGELPDWLVAER